MSRIWITTFESSFESLNHCWSFACLSMYFCECVRLHVRMCVCVCLLVLLPFLSGDVVVALALGGGWDWLCVCFWLWLRLYLRVWLTELLAFLGASQPSTYQFSDRCGNSVNCGRCSQTDARHNLQNYFYVQVFQIQIRFSNICVVAVVALCLVWKSVALKLQVELEPELEATLEVLILT